jgi:hypothetical protein
MQTSARDECPPKGKTRAIAAAFQGKSRFRLTSAEFKGPNSELVHELLNASNKGQGVRVRITMRPRELNIDGVDLETLRPGTVCDVSVSVGTWLIVQGYAYPEMRRTEDDISEPSVDAEPLPVERDRRRK